MTRTSQVDRKVEVWCALPVVYEVLSHMDTGLQQVCLNYHRLACFACVEEDEDYQITTQGTSSNLHCD